MNVLLAQTSRSARGMPGSRARSSPRQLRLGLCCQFIRQPIRFRTLTATALSRHPRPEQLRRLAEVAQHNASALVAALEFCATQGIGSFRILSSLLPVKTHPTAGYELDELPRAAAIRAALQHAGELARVRGIRTGFHPDQFVVLNSPDPTVVRRAIEDIESQAELAELTNADTVNIHGGGAYGDKRSALQVFQRNLDRLSARARQRLTVENDDKVFTPADLLPVCRAAEVPLVYDVHHHRCCPDRLSIAAATDAARATWDREPLFHLSSPLAGWDGPRPERHHDYISPADFPAEWQGFSLTVEVEAKAKELAVEKLQRELSPA